MVPPHQVAEHLYFFLTEEAGATTALRFDQEHQLADAEGLDPLVEEHRLLFVAADQVLKERVQLLFELQPRAELLVDDDRLY